MIVGVRRSRMKPPLLSLALFSLALSAQADTLRLLAPANGVTLRGGSFAELRWSAARLPAGAEEWEAFLSVNGGKYYAFRVTPHLEIDLQRFTFIVPNVDTHDARILIRVGNEVRETQFEIPASFSIAYDSTAFEGRLNAGTTPGEAAREGDPPVVAWTDGARNGSGLTQRASPTLPSASIRSLTKVTADASAALAPAESLVEAPSITGMQAAPRHKHPRIVQPLATPVDLLLVCSRRNI